MSFTTFPIPVNITRNFVPIDSSLWLKVWQEAFPDASKPVLFFTSILWLAACVVDGMIADVLVTLNLYLQAGAHADPQGIYK